MPCPADSGRRPVVPAGAPGRRLDHGPGPRVGEAGQPVLDRVPAGRGRELVHERLGREHVEERAEGAERGRAQRHVQQPVVDRPGRRESRSPARNCGPRRRRGPSAVPRRLRCPGRPRGDRPRAARPDRVRAGPGRVPVPPYLVPPGQDVPGLVHLGGEAHHGRGAERRPAEFVGPAPDDLDGPPGYGHGEQGGVQGDVVGAVVPVAAGARHVGHRDVVFGEAEGAGEFGAQRVDALGVRPHPQPRAALVADQRGGAGRPHGRVREVRPVVRGLGRRGDPAGDRGCAALGQHGGLGGRGAQEGRQVARVRQRRAPLPGGVGAQPVGGAQRDLLALGDHAEEAAVPHHREHAGQGERRRRVEAGERRAARRAGGRSGRNTGRPVTGHGRTGAGP